MTNTHIGEAVVAAVAEAKGVEPTALERSLSDVVDPDALEALFGGLRGDGTGAVRMTFNYSGRDVTVTGGGNVTVGESSEQSTGAAGQA